MSLDVYISNSYNYVCTHSGKTLSAKNRVFELEEELDESLESTVELRGVSFILGFCGHISFLLVKPQPVPVLKIKKGSELIIWLWFVNSKLTCGCGLVF